MHVFTLVFLFSTLTLAHSLKAQPPRLEIGDFVWAENLCFDGLGHMFVTDARLGHVFRVEYNSTSNSYERHIWIDGTGYHALGLTVSQDGSVMYAIRNKPWGDSHVISFDPTRAGRFAVLAKLPKAGNGLDLHWATNKLYTASEGSFLPYNGQVYEVDVASGKVRTILTGKQQCDGVRVDQVHHLLYVSEVILARLLVYDLFQDKLVKQFRIPSELKTLDDFALSFDGSVVYAADFLGKQVGIFDSASAEQAAASLRTFPVGAVATSVRVGFGANFRNTSLYVTQGGGIFTTNTKQKVIEFEGAV